MLISLVGPSAAGKSKILKLLVERTPNLVVPVSCTTRLPRPGERNKVDYFFVSDAEFDDMVARNALAEHATVHGCRYGTPRAEIDGWRREGYDMINDVDIKGALQLKEAYRWAYGVVILPPSVEEMIRRLRGRGTESPAAEAVRLETARKELASLQGLDYSIVNDNLEEAVCEARSLILKLKEGQKVEFLHTEHLEHLYREFNRLVPAA